MSNPTNSTEAKIVDAVMEELREIGPLANELDSLRDEEDAALRASLADRVHEYVEPYRTSERALRVIVKSLAQDTKQTPVRAEVFFGERMLSVTISMPTLTPEAEARLGQPIVDTIRGLLGLTGTMKAVSFGTDVEDASPGDQREPPGRAAAPSGGQAAHDVRQAGSSEAFMRKLWLLKPGADVSFRYRGEEHGARVLRVVRRGTASEKTLDLHTVDGSVYDVKAISDVQRLPSVPVVDQPGLDAQEQTLRVMLGDDTSTGVRFEYDGAQRAYGPAWDRRVYFQSAQSCWMVSFTRSAAEMPSFYRLDKILNAVSYKDAEPAPEQTTLDKVKLICATGIAVIEFEYAGATRVAEKRDLAYRDDELEIRVPGANGIAAYYVERMQNVRRSGRR